VVATKGHSQMPNLLRFVAYFFVHFHLMPLCTYPLRSLPTLTLLSTLPFHPLPFLKEVNKKLSYREQNAIRMIKTHEHNTVAKHILYASLVWPDGRIMFSTCPFVCPFVRLSVTNLWSYVWKPGRDIILDLSSRVDRDIQWAAEMLPLEGGVAHGFNCTPTFVL